MDCGVYSTRRNKIYDYSNTKDRRKEMEMHYYRIFIQYEIVY